jgi:hypothetical protein
MHSSLRWHPPYEEDDLYVKLRQIRDGEVNRAAEMRVGFRDCSSGEGGHRAVQILTVDDRLMSGFDL